jgi:hypothetical protein
MTDLYRYIDQHEQSPFACSPAAHCRRGCGKVLF